MSIITTAAQKAHGRRTATYRHATLLEENALATAVRGAGEDLAASAATLGLTGAELQLWVSDRRVPTDWTLPRYAA
ncbi:MAG: hypothetical protein U0Q15_12055 [Kineosporiaceae bacterium]